MYMNIFMRTHTEIKGNWFQVREVWTEGVKQDTDIIIEKYHVSLWMYEDSYVFIRLRLFSDIWWTVMNI